MPLSAGYHIIQKSTKRFIMKNSFVSVIITTRNSGKTIRQLLISIKNQTYKPIEIIVIDNNSSDKTIAIAKTYTKMVFLKGPERSVQRNFGAKYAQGKYLLILDSDMKLSCNVVNECVEKLENNKKIKALIIPEKSFGKGFWAKTKAFERELNQGEDYFEAARFFSKKIFWESNGYDESLTGPEDWDLPQRITKKYKQARINNYIFHNEGCPTLWGLAKKKYYYGLSVHKYLEKQNIFPINTKTVYFLRPAFYRNWQKILLNPLLSIGMFFMLVIETLGGGLGYIVGRLRNE